MAGDSFGILLNSYFDGDTGIRLQQRGSKDAFIVGLFLTANEFTNMIGLYELSLPKLERKLPIVKTRAALRRALEVLDEERYAHYDVKTEFVWVREMARVRLQLKGQPLAGNDKRTLGAAKVYAHLPLNPFLAPFYDRYGTELRLPVRRHGGDFNLEAPSRNIDKKPEAPSQAPSRNIDKKLEGASLTPSITSVISDQVHVVQKAAAAPRPSGTYDAPTVETVTTVVTKEIIPLLGALANFADLKDATASFLARNGMRTDGDTLRKAIESAQFRAGLARSMN